MARVGFDSIPVYGNPIRAHGTEFPVASERIAEAGPVRHPKVKVIASCGLHTDARSNTLVAFENAIRAGIEMTETDLRLCADGVILFHDEEIDGRPVTDLTRRQIRDLTGVLPPTLADFVECCRRGRMGIDFELKHSGFEEEVLELARSHFRPDQFIITSFEPTVLARVHELAPDAPTGYLTWRRLAYPGYEPLDTRPPVEVIELARELHADVVLPDYPDLELMQACDDAGTDTIAWAVDRAEHLRPLLRFERLRGVIGERPLLMRHLLEEDADPSYALELAA